MNKIGFENFEEIFHADPDTMFIKNDNIKEHNTDKIIDELFLVMTELDARNCSSNSVIEKYQGTYWKELCDIGIKLLEVLKK